MAGGAGAGWSWGRQGPIQLTPRQSLSHSPVFMTFWMALATCPLSRELRSLTRRMRQVQSTMRDPASSTSPTARSGSGVSVKRCSPAPQHGWARAWGQPGPTHKPVPPRQPHTWTQPKHLPALPYIMNPAPCPAPLHPTCRPPAPHVCPQPHAPCSPAPQPLTLLPGDVVETLDAFIAAVARGCAIRGSPKPRSYCLQGEGGLQLAPQHPRPAPAVTRPLWNCLVAPAEP